MVDLEEYSLIVGGNVIDELRLLAQRLQGKVIQNINSTAVGGGVAEILNRIIPLLKELGIDAHWDVIKGGEAFFQVTKKFHNALHGWPNEITKEDFDIFMETSRQNIEQTDIYGDIVFVHDPQPIALIHKKQQDHRKWLWRCHVDVSHPSPQVWDYLRQFILSYDACVF